MERLTKRINLGNGKTTVDFSNSKCGEFLTDHKAGVKALFEKLAEYEELEEQGLLLRLPIPIKSEVYCITNTLKVQLGIVQPEIKRMYVKRYEYNHLNNFTIVLGDFHIPFGIREGEVRIFKQELGKTVFLTKEEAEEALTKMKEGVCYE